MKKTAFLLSFLFMSIPCTAATITVNWDGSGDYTSIQAAIDDANDIDTVIVAPGTYYENLQMKNGVTLIGSGADVTTIDGGTNGHVVSFNLASGSISGFTITNSGDMPRYLTGVFTSQCTVTIENNVITDNYRGITVSSNSNATIRGNQIIYNSSIAIRVTSSEANITNNLIAHHSEQGISSSNSSPTITNNTIIDNDFAGILTNPISTQTIRNNIITQHEYGIMALGNDSSPVPFLSISYNNVWNNYQANYWYEWAISCIPEDPCCIPAGESEPFSPQPGTGEIHINPLFVTGPMGDYYLRQVAAGQGSNSPCVDAGSDTSASLGMDEYTTRTDQVADDGIVDMGCHYVPLTENLADINGDWSVDEDDLLILALQWLDAPGTPSADIAPEPLDNFVDYLDFAVIQQNWQWP